MFDQTPPLTRQTAKVVLDPIDYYTGARWTRRTWRASLAPREGWTGLPQSCEHRDGHRTVDAAKACGTAMWRKLPAE